MSCSGAQLSATAAASTTVLLSWQVMSPQAVGEAVPVAPQSGRSPNPRLWVASASAESTQLDRLVREDLDGVAEAGAQRGRLR